MDRLRALLDDGYLAALWRVLLAERESPHYPRLAAIFDQALAERYEALLAAEEGEVDGVAA